MKVKLFRAKDDELVIKCDDECFREILRIICTVQQEVTPRRESVNFADKLHCYFWAWNKLFYTNPKRLTTKSITAKRVFKYQFDKNTLTIYETDDNEIVLKTNDDLFRKIIRLIWFVQQEMPFERDDVNFADALYQKLSRWKILSINSDDVIKIKAEMSRRLNGNKFDDFNDIRGKFDPSCYYCGINLANRDPHKVMTEDGEEEFCESCKDKIESGEIEI